MSHSSSPISEEPAAAPLCVFMLDLLAVVPYYTAYLSRALLDAGVDLTVGSITYYLDPACFSSRGIRNDPGAFDLVGRLRLPRLPRRILKLAESLFNLAALTLRFARSAPDVLHVQFLPMLRWPVPLDLWFLRFARRRGAKIVLTVHDLLPHDTANRHHFLYRSLYHFVDSIICHSAAIQDRLVSDFEVDRARIHVIPHGPFFYDLPVLQAGSVLESFGVPSDAPLVLWQGLVFPYKGVDLLLDAWQQVEDRNDAAWLVVAGTGDPALLVSLKLQAAALHLKRVCLHQHFITSEQLVALYHSAEIVVYPYRAITTSGALATGLAFGKTILATDLPVFREILTDGISASLVAPEKNLLSQALLRLLSEPELRNIFSDKIRKLDFGQSSWQTIAAETMSAYNRVIASSRP